MSIYQASKWATETARTLKHSLSRKELLSLANYIENASPRQLDMLVRKLDPKGLRNETQKEETETTVGVSPEVDESKPRCTREA